MYYHKTKYKICFEKRNRRIKIKHLSLFIIYKKKQNHFVKLIYILVNILCLYT